MTAPTIGGNLNETLDRIRENKIIREVEVEKLNEEEKKIEEMILLKNEIITELDNKYHFDCMCLSIEKFNDILPSLINYINDPNPKLKESLINKIAEFMKCYRDG